MVVSIDENGKMTKKEIPSEKGPSFITPKNINAIDETSLYILGHGVNKYKFGTIRL